MYSNPTVAAEEIFAYLSLRDQTLAQAEECLTESALQRAVMANEFALTCLQRARSPYQAQCLEEPDAQRERQRCNTVFLRLQKLKARLASRSREPAMAA